MHVISLKALRDFWRRHPDAEPALRNWHTVVEHSKFESFTAIRRSFRSADYVAPCTVFDIGGNKYRIVAIIRYRDSKVFVRWVMTHREYDEWTRRLRSGKL
jgi:mRNA interferase HigB